MAAPELGSASARKTRPHRRSSPGMDPPLPDPASAGPALAGSAPPPPSSLLATGAICAATLPRPCSGTRSSSPRPLVHACARGPQAGPAQLPPARPDPVHLLCLPKPLHRPGPWPMFR
ncbi:WAS/WASL-interacting protein family member 1-like [Triticum aestivum]|uniref:WAS/WASL-interacting protein family member 1-like n=1 Tax=Triticum aestivum TaxID=4565 RepID=UPI001D00B2D5|nr:WAS/WASL-interacting protein family member 1-like [Triticum aestivum]